MASLEVIFSLSLLFIHQLNSMLSTDSTTFDTSSTPTSADSMSIIFMFLFLSTDKILGVQSCPGNFCIQGFFLFIVPHLDICVWHFSWLDAIPNWRQIRVQCFRWTYERTALPYSFSRLLRLFKALFSVDLASLHKQKTEDGVPDGEKNKLLSSVPTHQSFEVQG